jgi:hypothetical protein
MTLGRSRNWRSLSRFCKKFGLPKIVGRLGRRIQHSHSSNTQWPPTTTRRGRELPREQMPLTKRLPAPPSPSASRHRATSCTPSSVCAMSMVQVADLLTDACVQLLHLVSMCPPLPSSPLSRSPTPRKKAPRPLPRHTRFCYTQHHMPVSTSPLNSNPTRM